LSIFSYGSLTLSQAHSSAQRLDKHTQFFPFFFTVPTIYGSDSVDARTKPSQNPVKKACKYKTMHVQKIAINPKTMHPSTGSISQGLRLVNRVRWYSKRAKRPLEVSQQVESKLVWVKGLGCNCCCCCCGDSSLEVLFLLVDLAMVVVNFCLLMCIVLWDTGN